MHRLDIEGVSGNAQGVHHPPGPRRGAGPGSGEPELHRRHAPDALWVTDLTYVPTRSGMAYVCFIVDAFSRRIVGWRAASHMRTDMVLDALEMARRSRGNRRLVGLVTHSDAGSQFTSVRFTERLDEIGARPSIGTVADSYDNALAETTNGLYKTECVYGPDAPGRGTTSTNSSSPRSAGCTGSTRPPPQPLRRHPAAEFEAAFYAAQQPTPLGVGNQ
jgi:putative transposase